MSITHKEITQNSKSETKNSQSCVPLNVSLVTRPYRKSDLYVGASYMSSQYQYSPANVNLFHAHIGRHNSPKVTVLSCYIDTIGWTQTKWMCLGVEEIHVIFYKYFLGFFVCMYWCESGMGLPWTN